MEGPARDMSGKEAFYAELREKQTLDYAVKARDEWCALTLGKHKIFDALRVLEEYRDPSDPDTDAPNADHAFSTADACRRLFPEHDWLAVVGLVHDLGKVMACPDFTGKPPVPDWSVVGDTHVVGCALAPSCVFWELGKESKDWDHPVYSKHYGIYEPNTGMENLVYSFGHDEYMCAVLRNANHSLPDVASSVVRFHSLYPWHSGGDYRHLMGPGDDDVLHWVKAFQSCDLYPKADEPVRDTRDLYLRLLEKYDLDCAIRW